jgi:hypothetical protein
LKDLGKEKEGIEHIPRANGEDPSGLCGLQVETMAIYLTFNVA